MTIFLNDVPIEIPGELMTVKDLLKWKEIQEQGTAVAVNDKLIKHDQWPVKNLKELDRITIINAAFGG